MFIHNNFGPGYEMIVVTGNDAQLHCYLTTSVMAVHYEQSCSQFFLVRHKKKFYRFKRRGPVSDVILAQSLFQT